MTKKRVLQLVFLILVIVVAGIADLYESKQVSIEWAYAACVLAWIGILIAIYGFFTQTLPKLRSMYDRFFKKNRNSK